MASTVVVALWTYSTLIWPRCGLWGVCCGWVGAGTGGGLCSPFPGLNLSHHVAAAARKVAIRILRP